MENLFTGLPDKADQELVSVLARSSQARVERIVSTGQCSPEGFWYDQEEHEWVVVLAGQAGILLEGESSPRLMKPGDHMNIAAHRRHRVEWTSPDEPTVWLAVFYRDGA